jgi:hypothetical protein
LALIDLLAMATLKTTLAIRANNHPACHGNLEHHLDNTR